jgi:hypothetical protein
LRGAAGSGLGTTIKYLVNQKRGRGQQLGQGPLHKGWGVAAFVVNSEPHTWARPSVRVGVAKKKPHFPVRDTSAFLRSSPPFSPACFPPYGPLFARDGVHAGRRVQ